MRMKNQSVLAVDAMVLIAIGDQAKARTVRSIAEGIGMSVSYTEQMFARLRNAGLVRAERGPGGGYYVNGRADNITIADIVAVFEEPNQMLRPHRMAKFNGEAMTELSSVALFWEKLDRHVRTFLTRISLGDMVPHSH